MKKIFTIERPKTSLSPKTIRNYHSFVSSVLGYAVRMGMIRDNPARNVTLPSAEQKEKGVFTDTTKTAKSQRALKLPLGVFEVLKKHRAAQSEERITFCEK